MKRAALSIVGFALSLGLATGAVAEPRVGDRFGDWAFECTAQSASITDCGLAQLIVADGTNDPIARIRVNGPIDGQEQRLSALVPLGVDIQEGISATFDTGAEIAFLPLTCVAQGCFFVTPLTADLAVAMLGAETIAMRFQLVGGARKYAITVTLRGLSEAFEETGWF